MNLKILLTKSEVAFATGFSESTIDRMQAAGTFPKAVRINGLVRWRVRDINIWEESLCAEQFLEPIPPMKRGRPRLAI
jgi:predicted DNA-binding transcriptional regulator AlpA